MISNDWSANPGHDHVNRVGADVDCGESHVGEAERCASIGILPRHFHGTSERSPGVALRIFADARPRDARRTEGRALVRVASRRLREALRLISHPKREPEAFP